MGAVNPCGTTMERIKRTMGVVAKNMSHPDVWELSSFTRSSDNQQGDRESGRVLGRTIKDTIRS